MTANRKRRTFLRCTCCELPRTPANAARRGFLAGAAALGLLPAIGRLAPAAAQTSASDDRLSAARLC